MALPPISGSNRPEFVNPYTHVEDVAARLAKSLTTLGEAITNVTAPEMPPPKEENFLKIAQLVRSIQQDTQAVSKSVGDSATVLRVKDCVQDIATVLSTPGASIIGAVEEDAKEGSSVTTHLQKELDTFAKLPFASQNLAEELNNIAHDIQMNRPRHIG